MKKYDRNEGKALPELFAVEDVKFTEHENLARHSAIGIGGPAEIAAFPRTEKAFMTLLRVLAEENRRYLVVGNATNLLFDDTGFPGVIVFTKELHTVQWNGDSVRASCGVSITSLAAKAAERGLSGLEFAYGIPGTVGGAVYMNAGAYESEIAHILTESTCLSCGKLITRRAAEHEFAYRSSIYRRTGETILSAEFTLQKSDSETVRTASKRNMEARREKQPLEYPNLGSTFKRPAGAYAGVLIESAGLKGKRIGGAEVSEKHAGFIINRGGATAADVLRLIEFVQKEVQSKTGILLEPEIIHVI